MDQTFQGQLQSPRKCPHSHYIKTLTKTQYEWSLGWQCPMTTQSQPIASNPYKRQLPNPKMSPRLYYIERP
jgi:hypothetical protein